MKIVYIIGGIHVANGMSDVMTRKVNWLARNTDAELYVVLTERSDLQPFYALDQRVKVVNFNLNFDRLDTLPLWRKVLLYRRLMRRYRRCLTDYLMQLKADVVVSALRRDINFLTAIADGSRKVGELHFARSCYRVFSKPWLPTWVNTFVTRRWQSGLISRLRRLDAFVVLSHEDAAAWPELSNLRVIPNSIKLTHPTQPHPLTPSFPSKARLSVAFPKGEGDAYGGEVGESDEVVAGGVVLAAGRYTYQKGFDLLLRSWARVEAAAPSWQLHIYGSGDAEPYVALSRELGLQRVTCHPATADLQGVMRRSSIFAFSSRYEGFGLVLAEAMACGMAVVSYACPCGPRDIVSHGRDGLLVEPVGDTDAFADALLRLIADDALRGRLADAAVVSSRRFAEDNVMQQWLSLFGTRKKNCL